MPLKLICKHCGELMYYTSSDKDFSVPDIIFNKLHENKCPKCGRKITAEDLESWTLEISGRKATRKFYMESAKPKFRRDQTHWLSRGHSEPESFSVVKLKNPGRPRR